MAIIEPIVDSDAMTGSGRDKINQAIALINSFTSVPIGMVSPYYGSPTDSSLWDVSGIGKVDTAMEKFALCLGQGLSGSLLTNHDGSSRSSAPDLRGRFPVGWSSTETEFAAVGQVGGEKEVTLTEEQLAPHNHPMRINKSNVGAGLGMFAGSVTPAEYTNPGDEEVMQNAGGGEPHNNLPPYLTTGYIIRYK